MAALGRSKWGQKFGASFLVTALVLMTGGCHFYCPYVSWKLYCIITMWQVKSSWIHLWLGVISEWKISSFSWQDDSIFFPFPKMPLILILDCNQTCSFCFDDSYNEFMLMSWRHTYWLGWLFVLATKPIESVSEVLGWQNGVCVRVPAWASDSRTDMTTFLWWAFADGTVEQMWPWTMLLCISL